MVAMLLLICLAIAAAEGAKPHVEGSPFGDLPYQSLDPPFHGQHVGVAYADLNNDGATDLLFAAGRHWVDQSYALINLGPEYNDNGEFVGVKFSEALPIGSPGAYYQIDVTPSELKNDETAVEGSTQQHHSTVLLVGGTCHVDQPNDFGSCKKGDNTPARVVHVTMNKEGGCSIQNPEVECQLDYTEVWEHPNPQGDRNGGFATFGDDQRIIALLGEGGIELFQSMETIDTVDDEATPVIKTERRQLLHTTYSSAFHAAPPPKTDPRSDFARYAGFAAGNLPNLGGVVAAGRRTDYDAPQFDEQGNVVGINLYVYEDGGESSISSSSFKSTALSAKYSGEPYQGDPKYSIQTTNYAFADIDGDGVQDLLEATFLYSEQRVPDYPLPQRIHFLNEDGQVKDTLIVLENGAPNSDSGIEDENDAGRSVTTGQIFADSSLPDVVFASAEGVVSIFANLGVLDKDTGKFRGLEMRYQLSIGTSKCQVRDVAVTKLAHDRDDADKCWVGIVSAVTCGIEIPGKNHIFYVEGNGAVCEN